MLLKPQINPGLIGHLACMQTSLFLHPFIIFNTPGIPVRVFTFRVESNTLKFKVSLKLHNLGWYSSLQHCLGSSCNVPFPSNQLLTPKPHLLRILANDSFTHVVLRKSFQNYNLIICYICQIEERYHWKRKRSCWCFATVQYFCETCK